MNRLTIRGFTLLGFVVLAVASAAGATNLPQKGVQHRRRHGIGARRRDAESRCAGGIADRQAQVSDTVFRGNHQRIAVPDLAGGDLDVSGPEKRQAAEIEAHTQQEGPAQGSYWFYSDKLGVIVDQPIVVEMRAYSDEKRANPVGGQVAELMFDQRNVDVFFENFPSGRLRR